MAPAVALWLAAAVFGQADGSLSGERPEATLFDGTEPASQWIGGTRPMDVCVGDESVHQGLFATPVGHRQPRLLQRLLGNGQVDRPPAQRESWLRRPMSISWAMGGVVGSPLIDDWVRADGGMYGGLRLGWDFDHYWGTEARLSFATARLVDSQRARDAQTWYDNLTGYSPVDPYRTRFDRRDADMMSYDISALYYPWGDTPFRPYVLVGLGGTQVSFTDRLGESYDNTLLTMPLALGFKYHWTDWMALRFEICDNMAFGAGPVSTLHNIAITGTAEIRFGGSRRSYWPWIPSRRSW